MNEDTARDLPARSFEERVLAEFAALNSRFDKVEARLDKLEARFDKLETRFGNVEVRLDAVEERLTTLEERVDMRLRETRPIWEGMQEQLQRLNTKLDIFFGDFNELRTQQTILLRRVDKLETAAPSQ